MAPVELETRFLGLSVRRERVEEEKSFAVSQTSAGHVGAFLVKVVPDKNLIFVSGDEKRPVDWAKLLENRIPGGK